MKTEISQMTSSFFDNYAIIFAGGGSKGAWQLGAWKAFNEMGIKPATMVSGTSVGALNAAMYSQQNFSKAEAVWTSIDTPIVLEGVSSKTASWLIKTLSHGITQHKGIPEAMLKKLELLLVSPMLLTKGAMGWMSKLLLGSEQSGLFSSNGLNTLIDNGLEWYNNYNFKIPAYICTHNKNINSVEYFPLHTDQRSLADRKSLLLASASIPYIFPEVTIGSQKYCDGGWGIRMPEILNFSDNVILDNVPIRPVVDSNPELKNYIILGLSPDEMTYRSSPEFQNVHIFPLRPEHSLGNPLDFTQNHVKELINDGYHDALRWLDKLMHNAEQCIISNDTWKKLENEQNKMMEILKNNEAFIEICNEYLIEEQKAYNQLLETSLRANRETLETSIETYRNWVRYNDISSLALPQENLAQDSIESLKQDFQDLSLQAQKHSLELTHEFNEILAAEKSTENKKDWENEHRKQHEAVIRLFSITKDILNDNLALHTTHATKTTAIIQKVCEMNAVFIRRTIFEIRDHGIDLLKKYEIELENKRREEEQKQRDLQMSRKIDTIIDSTASQIASTTILQAIPRAGKSFVGRHDDLQALEHIMSEDPQCIPLIHAPAGTGKSMLAFKYAEEHKNDYQVELLVKSEGLHSLEEVFCTIADSGLLENTPFSIIITQGFDNSMSHAEQTTRKCRQVIRSLERASSVLLILDNIDDASFLRNDVIENWLLKSTQKNWRLIATTRNNIIRFSDDDYVHPFELSGLSEDDAFKLLTRNQILKSPAENEAAHNIVAFLEGNAWALDLIREEIKQQGNDYDDEYQNWMKRLDGLRGRALKSEELSIHNLRYGAIDSSELFRSTVEQLTFIQKIILQYLILADPDFLFVDLIKKIQIFMKYQNYDNRTWNAQIKALVDRHLLLLSTNEKSVDASKNRMFRMHRLTYHSLNELLPDPTLDYAKTACEWVTEYIRNSGEALSSSETLALGRAVLLWLKQPWKYYVLPIIYSLSLKRDLGDYLSTYKLFSLRKEICELSCYAIEEITDKTSEEYLKYTASMNVLMGHIELDEQHYEKAKQHYLKSLQIREQIFGHEAPETSLLHQYIGSAYIALQQPECAIKEYELAVKIQKTMLANIKNDPVSLGTFIRLYDVFIVGMLKLRYIERADKLMQDISPYITLAVEQYGQHGDVLLAKHFAIRGDYFLLKNNKDAAKESYINAMNIIEKYDTSPDGMYQKLKNWLVTLN